jgi:HD-GYP domain-containing protein (c-di-GMP phosphodiesterase class II)
MALRKRDSVSSRKPRGSLVDGPAIACELVRLIEGEALQPHPEEAALQQLHLLARAAARLWRDISMTAVEVTPASERHSNRVALFSLRIARVMGLSEKQVLRILRAAYLHDVGEVAVSGPIMLKPGRLAAEEREAMQAHSIVG